MVVVAQGVCGKALLFSIGVGVRPKPTTKHSVFFFVSSNSSSNSNSNSNSNSTVDKTTSFGRLKVQKVNALIHRTKQNTTKRKLQLLQLEDEDEDNSSATATTPPPPPRQQQQQQHTHSRVGWGDNRISSQSLALASEETNFFSLKSFKDIGCADFMIESLHNLSLTRPSNIQAMSFAPVIAGKSCIIADQSGSGKTLAYLLPIIQRLRQQELQGLHKSSSQSPTLLILAPTSELASQVFHNCRSISKSGRVPFKSMLVTGGFRQKTQLDTLNQGVDVLIATPGRFLFLINQGFLHLTNLTW